LITVGGDGLYNLFPTDLHGPAGDGYYVGSLRHEGVACKQVEAAGRAAITQIHCDAYKTAYSLGKNHMQQLRPRENFPFGDIDSPRFQLPLPKWALRYRELEVIGTFVHGIHKLFLFKVVSGERLSDAPATLAHVHNCYATWRYKHRISSNLMLR
jgi:hypothetical protein